MNTQLETENQVTVHTLGCKLNYAETSSLARQFVAHGFEIGPLSEKTNVFLLNTCSVTENAERECRQVIRRVLRLAPTAFIAVTGCYAQLRPEEIASIDGVDVVLGSKEKFELFERVDSFQKSVYPKIYAEDIADADRFDIASSNIEGERTRAFLKVQDGCDYSCAFCTIPAARGVSRSIEIEPILQEARRLCSDGFREIVLSGVNVGDYGRKIGLSFYALLSAIETDPEITARIRVSSIEPNLLTEEIISLFASSRKLCPHFHIPLQSGSPTVLKRMQRRYTPELYESRIDLIKALMPNAAIGVDVIVGFPGETAEEFEETHAFLSRLDIAYLHVFTYSERPGTKASEMAAPIPQQLRKERNKKLRILSEKKRRSFYTAQAGKLATVLVEQRNLSCATDNPFAGVEGYTENYVRVRLSALTAEGVEVLDVRLGEVVGDVVLARPIKSGIEPVSAFVPSKGANFNRFHLPVINS